MSHDTPIAPEKLLAHSGWVQALARQLVRDESTADDLVQDTWLAALRRPPRRSGPLRGWLSTVLRNRARETHRRESRRVRRETEAALPERTLDAAEVVARADAHKDVVLAVLALEEPYRTTILFRYFEANPVFPFIN